MHSGKTKTARRIAPTGRWRGSAKAIPIRAYFVVPSFIELRSVFIFFDEFELIFDDRAAFRVVARTGRLLLSALLDEVVVVERLLFVSPII